MPRPQSPPRRPPSNRQRQVAFQGSRNELPMLRFDIADSVSTRPPVTPHARSTKSESRTAQPCKLQNHGEQPRDTAVLKACAWLRQHTHLSQHHGLVGYQRYSETESSLIFTFSHPRDRIHLGRVRYRKLRTSSLHRVHAHAETCTMLAYIPNVVSIACHCRHHGFGILCSAWFSRASCILIIMLQRYMCIGIAFVSSLQLCRGLNFEMIMFWIWHASLTVEWYGNGCPSYTGWPLMVDYLIVLLWCVRACLRVCGRACSAICC